MGVEIELFEFGAYRSDERASLKQMTGTQDSEYNM